MNCEQVKELLSAYLDDALAPAEREEVAAHLQDCPACSSILLDYRRLDSLLVHLPRVSPDAALREKIFSSPEYLELTGTFGGSERADERTIPHQRIRHVDPGRPRLIALPGGRQSSSSTLPPDISRSPYRTTTHRRRNGGSSWGLRAMQIAIAAALLLTLGIGSLIGWNLWRMQKMTATNVNGITPPAGLQQGPIPAGVRFVFLRDAALWSAPTDGGSGILRLTPQNVTVAENWAVRPALPGRPAGNMLAYIDLQRGFVHIIRSDGQSDTAIAQPLLKPGVAPSSMWDTGTGAAILSSLNWSKDGSMLAFVADPHGIGQPGLYIYSTGTGEVHAVPLPLKGVVSHPVWSPDGVRIAFELISNGNTGILDYNTQNHGMLTITSSVDTPQHPDDTVLALAWSGDVDVPAITWSVGTPGHVHGLWSQRVGVASILKTQEMVAGDYPQATYSQTARNGAGGWLLVGAYAGRSTDLFAVDLSGVMTRLTAGKQVSFVQWSPDGLHIDYLDALSSGIGTLHMLDVNTGSDTLVSTGVADDPVPAWSTDGQRLVYSTGMHVLVVNVQASRTSQPLKLQGPASAFSWSTASPSQLVLAMSDGQEGIYLVDTQHGTMLQLDNEATRGPISWTQIP